MLKKILTALVAMMALVAHGQTGVGNWRIHPFYVGSAINNLIDTDDRVYYLVGNYLYGYDKSTQENESYSQLNYLNDVTVTGIYYNYGKHYLAVAYANSSIDIIDASGRVTYLPDIKDATLTGAKGINDITFADGVMLVATQFGFVTYDDTKFQVVESHAYDADFGTVSQVGGWLVAVVDGGLRAAPANGHNEQLTSFVPVMPAMNRLTQAQSLVVNAATLILNSDRGLNVLTLGTDDDNNLHVIANLTVNAKRAATVQPITDGFIASYLSADSCYYRLDATGANPTRVNAGAELYSAAPDGDGTLWALSADGLHRAEDTQNYYKPDGIGIKVGAFYMAYSEGLRRLYLTSASDNEFADWGSSLGAVTQIFAYDGNQWQDVTPDNLPGDGVSANWQMVVDPRDSHTYVYPSRKYGVVKVTDDKIVAVYDASNSLFGNNYYKGACAFDSEGNLWVVYSSNAASSESAQNVAVLPRAKYESNNVAATDWIAVNVPGTKQQYFKNSTFLITNDVKLYNSGGYEKPFACWYNSNGLSGTPARANFSHFTDQDGKQISWTYVYSVVSDKQGRVWVGMDNGVISLDPTRMFDNDFTVNHIKVPRNDGTGLADYLLDGVQVNCIAVDGANRKWIGTNSSGLFLVSADGSQVLQQFTTDNSLLTSNVIYNVCCNPTNNSVYVVTPDGFLEYFSDTTPGAASYSNVIVYPNPVRPDYMGMVTITGLMDNSLVKIADASGQVIKQLRSTGGMATWDCNDNNGERVSTGVYYVMASEHEGGSANATVAKFLVVK